MDYSVIPDILKDANMDDERPWNLKKMRELLIIAYELAEHPILKNWRGHDPIDIFDTLDFDLEKFKRFNRTIIERTITQSEYYSHFESDLGIMTMRSKGIEYSIITVEYFFRIANKLYNSTEDELDDLGIGVISFRLTESGALTAAITYFMEICNNIIELTLKHFILDQVKKLSNDNDKVKYLLRQKADLLLQKDQFQEKVLGSIITTINVELEYHKGVKELMDIPIELKGIINQFFTEKDARISNNKLLLNLMEDKLDEFCNNLSELVLQLFSYHDIGSQEPEKVYHTFLLGVFNSFKDIYRIESNRESGNGRFDILLIPETLEYKGMIIEIKRSLVDSELKINKMLNEALHQIINNNYAIILKSQGHKEYIAIAAIFYGKRLSLKNNLIKIA